MKLSPAQYEVARLRAAAVPRHEIARRLGIALNTVDQHSLAARRRLGVESRRALSQALPDVTVVATVRRNRYGYAMGDELEVIGGLYAGRRGRFAGVANSRQVKVRIGGGVFALMAWNVRRPERQPEATA